jgi:hypothetical protein
VKNQYFGDKRDFVKYQLLEWMALGTPGIRQLTCIWMLTPPTPNNDGNRRFLVHPGSERVGEFLRGCVESGRRDVRELTRYFAESPFRYSPYGDNVDQYFTTSDRRQYFASIPKAVLNSAIVFLDPDNGMEPQRVVMDSHLRYSELASVFDRMDDKSIAVVYQHRPRRKAEDFWPEVGSRIGAYLRANTYFLADAEVAFYVVPKSRRLAGLNEALLAFSASWPSGLRVGGPLPQ